MTAGDRRALLAVVVTLAAVAGILLATGRWWVRPYAVAGPSMEPTLSAGDRVLVDLRAYRDRRPRVGEVVVVRVPDAGTVVKRVVAAPGPGAPASRSPAIWVRGDRPGASLDSRGFGPVPPERWVGRVVLRYWPPSRAGRIESRPPPAAAGGSGFRLPSR